MLRFDLAMLAMKTSTSFDPGFLFQIYCNCGVSNDLILGFFTKPDLSTEGSGSPVITVDNNSLTSMNTTNWDNRACQLSELCL